MQTSLRVVLIVISGWLLWSCTSCESDTPSQSPQGYDPHIDAIAAAPLPTVDPAWARGMPAAAEGRFPDSSGRALEPMTPPTESSLPAEPADTSGPPPTLPPPDEPNSF